MWPEMGETTNEISGSEKLEIIRLVERSHLPARRTLDHLGVLLLRAALRIQNHILSLV